MRHTLVTIGMMGVDAMRQDAELKSGRLGSTEVARCYIIRHGRRTRSSRAYKYFAPYSDAWNEI